MNGAESLIRSLVAAGVDVCFANPGTSEMHLVQAIDAVPEMRGILSLFEGVCTGEADGYGRMMGKPATTLLHLGPGLGNGIANLHNARRAATPVINLVGNHALYHVELDAPLTSDIDTLARNVSCWIKSDSTAASLSSDGMQALQASLTARPGSSGQIASLIIPADACWEDASSLAEALRPPERPEVDDQRVRSVAESIGPGTLLLLDGDGLSIEAKVAANRIRSGTGCRVALGCFPARIDGGAGLPSVERLPYFPEHVLGFLNGVSQVVLAGAQTPASFFAYPDTPGILLPEGCEDIRLSDNHENTTAALQAIAEHLGLASAEYDIDQPMKSELPMGQLTTAGVAAALANCLPEGAIVCTDSGGGGAAFAPTRGAPPHTWLNLTGGSIGQAGPVAVGAAVACPDRSVFALIGDGAAMYTNQAFWTQAREGLNITSIIFNNAKYGILETEYLRLGVNQVGERAAELFDLSRPAIDYVQLASSMGVPGCSVDNVDECISALQVAAATEGPYVIEARL